MKNNEIKISKDELGIFQNMLINFGNSIDKIENHYNNLSESKLIIKII